MLLKIAIHQLVEPVTVEYAGQRVVRVERTVERLRFEQLVLRELPHGF
ncbi:hypothetical protein SDC9_151474 [bioreactor metagenome]|uniref:Uncharacterized protein n=1 Tax=bioreactor metagenome TaxID=1076179 RepID=A0A645EQE2_9ZZZZ